MELPFHHTHNSDNSLWDRLPVEIQLMVLNRRRSSIPKEVHRQLLLVTRLIRNAVDSRGFYGWVNVSEFPESPEHYGELSTHSAIRRYRTKMMDGTYTDEWYVALTAGSFFLILPAPIDAKIVSNFNYAGYTHDDYGYIAATDIYGE
jgi:hypothetical protein